MKTDSKKFLEFNGKTVFFVAVDGQYWIALKPICEARNVDYIRQFKHIKEDEILSELLSEQTMVAADGKSRQMSSLPEKWIYGWIMQLESKSPELLQYKKLCYEVLNDYFHGAITGRKNLLAQKAKAQAEIDGVMNRMDPNDAITIEQGSKAINQINVKLRALDNEIMQEERDLFTQ
jgi:hypothetical protein